MEDFGIFHQYVCELASSLLRRCDVEQGFFLNPASIQFWAIEVQPGYFTPLVRAERILNAGEITWARAIKELDGLMPYLLEEARGLKGLDISLPPWIDHSDLVLGGRRISLDKSGLPFRSLTLGAGRRPKLMVEVADRLGALCQNGEVACYCTSWII